MFILINSKINLVVELLYFNNSEDFIVNNERTYIYIGYNYFYIGSVMSHG